ncbi:7,8-didemethyl-8-hydroxy-5-deazariboflavin synthase CofG [Gordonia pseudamarae]|jgi:7,8-didemethyl-8-hydroxy-5-deazariboflavin synthase CofG subunit|nr:7,8-didemethyl-8-hydroxy-5-deazariboflavin synthase CofG [Gordonia sp. (in: high G+C Gram-positive bacteria)]
MTTGLVSMALDAARVAAATGRSAALDDVVTLLSCRGADLRELQSVAARLRDEGLAAAGRPGRITYSRKVFVPLTRLCRDRCHYCTFVTVPGKLRRDGHGMYLEIDQVVALARQGAALGCKEALFTLGDRPEDRWPEAGEWLAARGYSSTLDYVRAASVAVLEGTGLLPHLNPGVMSLAELRELRPVAPSMGMMLETTARRLFTDKGQPHYGSPDKDPLVRLQVLRDAGTAKVPFTTGILVGIGETLTERAESLLAIADVHRAYGHIQEVIVQNFRAKPDTAMRGVPDAEMSEFLAAVAVARVVMGPEVAIQAPPNLVSQEECAALIASGIADWGGVSPLTPDHVNPERPWPNLDTLADLTARCGFTLTERVTAEPPFVLDRESWIDDALTGHLDALADPVTGLAADVRPAGLPWPGVPAARPA